MRILPILITVIALSGCTTLSNSAAVRAGKVISEYCSFSPMAREAFRAIVNEESFPHTIAIECKGDL